MGELRPCRNSALSIADANWGTDGRSVADIGGGCAETTVVDWNKVGVWRSLLEFILNNPAVSGSVWDFLRVRPR